MTTLSPCQRRAAVTVYATADETSTIVDTSGGTSVSIPAESDNDYLYTFSTSGGTPQLTGYVDADAALSPVATGDQETAYSNNLDGPVSQSGDPSPVATDQYGNPVNASENTAAPCIGTTAGGRHGGFDCSNLDGTADWAENHTQVGTKKYYNGFLHNDCTDFASRSMAFGGKMPEDISVAPSVQRGDKYWFQVHPYPFTYTSHSWDGAFNLANFFFMQGSYYRHTIWTARPGEIIFAAIHGGGFNSIDHTGVITKVNHHNIYITQHSASRINEPLLGPPGSKTWFGRSPHLKNVFIVIPARKA